MVVPTRALLKRSFDAMESAEHPIEGESPEAVEAPASPIRQEVSTTTVSCALAISKSTISPDTPNDHPMDVKDPPPTPVKSAPVKSDQCYYAVANARSVGVNSTWAEMCVAIAKDKNNSVFRMFPTHEEATSFIRDHLDRTHSRPGDPDPQHATTLVAFCNSVTEDSRFWSREMVVACVFPHNCGWNEAFTCQASIHRAAAMAALEAIQRANTENVTQDKVLYIYTQSHYFVRAMTGLLGKWTRNGWRKNDDTAVKHQDIFKQLITAQGKRRIAWCHEDDWGSQFPAKAAPEDAAASQ